MNNKIIDGLPGLLLNKLDKVTIARRVEQKNWSRAKILLEKMAAGVLVRLLTSDS